MDWATSSGGAASALDTTVNPSQLASTRASAALSQRLQVDRLVGAEDSR
ncbi:hypothetical protein ACQ4N7_02995 [Nodosilinea sp. AN01ver1]